MAPNSSDFFSPAEGLSDGFNVGTASTPPQPSVYPDIDMTNAGGAGQAPATKDTEAIGGVGATSGAFPAAQLFTGAPESYDTGGDPMVGEIGKPPKP